MIKKQLLQQIKKDKIKFVYYQFSDILGKIKSVMVPIEKVSNNLDNGIWFDGSSIEGFARIWESDMLLKPDLDTYAVIPWIPKERRSARFICDVFRPDGTPFPGDPRYVLKKITGELKKMGYLYNVGPELEFFLLKNTENSQPLNDDTGGYFDFTPNDLASQVIQEVILNLKAFGIQAEAGHHEVAPGQHEIDIRYNEADIIADRMITLKTAIKGIAQKYNLVVTFMPKPFFGINGSGMHIHQSLFNLQGKNVFYDAKDKYKLAKIAYHFLAGQLNQAESLSVIIAPTVNSYKRLVPGYEAPVYICWGQTNRSALIRIPRFTKGKIQSTRMEFRAPDPACNPYLAFAALLAAGMYGLKKKLKPGKPEEENVYDYGQLKLKAKGIKTLPESLGEAIHHCKNNKIITQALGEHITASLIEVAQLQWDEYRTQITGWEFKRYLDI